MIKIIRSRSSSFGILQNSDWPDYSDQFSEENNPMLNEAILFWDNQGYFTTGSFKNKLTEFWTRTNSSELNAVQFVLKYRICYRFLFRVPFFMEVFRLIRFFLKAAGNCMR